ncbi:hypothetical protein K8Z61_18475 [Nocardioides sp. TRM66260-LWL]|uniref:hypothetical protein n=1 Tax=Nocardioides sp. TRM66260-LWL TaxID=2874478 RepID=UPI001CC77024|nr:hypothetical protein [Nocardioides sp. TRM66260-LWL]MBZ5736481.1 hypothetical protein [Nocardioides sp. TRM66260-LWL]
MTTRTATGRELKDPRDSAAWRRLRDQVIREEPTCRLAFPSICTGLSETADHIEPFTAAPHLAMERSNHRGTCHACNRARSSTPDAALNLTPSKRPPALSIFD